MLKKRGRKIWGLSLSFLCFSTSSTATASSPSEGPKGNGKLYGLSPDKFVQASPLVMAAVCRDGVAVVAAHTSDEDEPLLYYSPAGADKPAAEDGDYLDLPDTFAGPFRIHAIDAFGTTMLASGWRADCDEIVARARDLSSAEVQRYGPPISGSMSYARYLTAELSLFMALCVVSEGVSYSCVSCDSIVLSCLAYRV